jgi:MFS transporter, PAT family, beta-lactamase induction signal transducer AmpG
VSETPSSHHPAGYQPPSPFLYFILFLPFGATGGYITVTLGTLASDAGLSDGVVAGFAAATVFPHAWKVLWAPLVDTVWTNRNWYISTNLISSAAIIALGFIPIDDAHTGLITAVILINGFATTFVGMCTESLMARLCTPEQRGWAGGWSQAGNVGGVTLGGVGLIIANHSDITWLPAIAIGTMLMGCSVALSFVEEPPPTGPRPSFGAGFSTLARDIWHLLIDEKRASEVSPKGLLAFPLVMLWALSGAGILTLALCLVPIGSGGAQNLFGAMGKEWGASQDLIGTANGLISGVAAILGSLVGGVLSDKLDKRWAYALSGLALSCVAFAWAASPQQAEVYVAGVLLYNFAIGMCYATFTAFVLDIIGHTGGATKYNLFASLANVPIILMTTADGAVSDSHGRIAMLVVDGLAGVAGATVLMAVVWILRRTHKEPRPAE